MARTAASRGWIVTFAGLGLNLALGILYSWSIIAKTLSKSVAEGGWGWSAGEASLPYAVAVGVFALSMVFAGRAQDRFGPRVVATLGGALCGAGLLVASLGTQTQRLPIVLGFGLLTGLGIGLGYAAATPAAVKWFSPARKGLITGIVVSGFGLASVYIAPLTSWLLGAYGVAGTFRTLGVAFTFVTITFASLLSNPPAGVRASHLRPRRPLRRRGVAADYDWREMVRTKQFVLLWLMYAFAAFAGLMIIGHMAKIAALQLSAIDLGFVLVAVLAIGNALGRLVAGIVADRIGGIPTMRIVFIAQAVMMGVAGAGGQRAHARSGRRGDRLLLRREPVAVPVDDRRLLRHQEPRRELRSRLHGVGRGRRVRLDGGRHDRGPDGDLRVGLRRCRGAMHCRFGADLRHEAPEALASEFSTVKRPSGRPRSVAKRPPLAYQSTMRRLPSSERTCVASCTTSRQPR